MNGDAKFLLSVVALLGMIAIGAWIGISIWNECLEAGHSVLYCLKMATR